MSNSGKSKQQKPASSKGVPVLTILFSLLFLALAALGGWLYWSDLKTGGSTSIAVIAEITPPIPASEAAPDATSKPDPVPEKESRAEEEPIQKPAELPTDQPVEGQPAKEPAETEVPVDAEAPVETQAPIETEAAKPTEEKAIETPAVEKPAIPEAKPVQQETKPETPVEPKPAEQPAEEKVTEEKPQPLEPQEEKAPEPKPEPKAETPAATTKPTESGEKGLQPPAEEKPLPPVPDPELVTKSDFGLLPIISPSGRQAWRAYARPFDDPLDRPRIAIIISEMGMSPTATRSTIQNLPGAVTLSFNPYARDLQSWVEQARAAGHEALLQLPMEPFGYPKNDPGEHSLLTSLTDRENLNRLEWMLGRFTGYSGVTNQMGSKFTAAAEDIQPILDVIKTRGLLFIDGRTSAKSVAGQLAGKAGIPVAINNRFLDHKADRTTIDARLKDLERIARYTGTAVGIGYPYPVTLERINIWAQTLARKGIVLVPVSAAINRQEIR